MSLTVTPVPVEKLHADPRNRPDGSGGDDIDGLARTIRVLGILQPLLVEPMPDRPGHYLIRAGHRRRAAAEKCGLGVVPCIIRRGITGQSATTGALLAVVENFQRAALGPVELALRLGELRDAGMSAAAIARYTGMKDAAISYHLELLDLDDSTLNQVRNKVIPVGAAHEAVKAFRAAAPPPGPAEITVRPRSYRSGGTAAGRKPKDRPHFAATHPLAGDAAGRCVAAWHRTGVLKYGKVACGPCWEAAITAHALNGGGRDRQPRDPAEVLAGLGLTEKDLLPHVRDALFSDVLPPPVPAPVFSAGGRP